MIVNADEARRDPSNDFEILRNDPDGVYFWGGVFSNFEYSPITIDGKEYKDVESYFQACKAIREPDHEYVRLAPGPGEAKRRGRGIELRPDWEQVKYDVMLRGLRAKFAPNTTFAMALLDTGTRNIYEDSPTDYEWGFRKGGRNLLGKALMEIRAELARGEFAAK